MEILIAIVVIALLLVLGSLIPPRHEIVPR
jgi:hypothetical protein